MIKSISNVQSIKDESENCHFFACMAIVSVLGQGEIDTSLVQFMGEFSEST
jgi:hypothetical protein